jgi:hypothetical protein
LGHLTGISSDEACAEKSDQDQSKSPLTVVQLLSFFIAGEGRAELVQEFGKICSDDFHYLPNFLSGTSPLFVACFGRDSLLFLLHKTVLQRKYSLIKAEMTTANCPSRTRAI